MGNERLTIIFPQVRAADGNRLADSLANAIRDADLNVVVELNRERPDTQDLGATLALTLGTAAATSIARGIAAWLARNSGAQIEVRRGDKLVLKASGLDSKDVPRIAAAISNAD